MTHTAGDGQRPIASGSGDHKSHLFNGTKILYPQKYITFEKNMYTANVLTITSRDGDGVILFISIIDINVGNCLFWAPTKNNLQSNELKIIILKDNKLNLSWDNIAIRPALFYF